MTQLYEKAREFAAKFIDPVEKELDENATFPSEIFKKLGEQGFLSLLIPQKYGGAGAGIEEHAQVCAALAQSSASVGLCYMMNNVALNCIAAHAGEDVKAEIFADVVKNGKFAALAYSELGTGTHFYFSDTTSRFEGDKAILNGLKSMVTSGSYASYYLVLAQSNDASQIDNWIIPSNSTGLSF